MCRLRNRFGAKVCAECGAPLSIASPPGTAPPVNDGKTAINALIAQLGSAGNRREHLHQLAVMGYQTGEVATVFPVIAREIMQSPWDAELIQLAIDLDGAAVDQNRHLISDRQSKVDQPQTPRPDYLKLAHFMEPLYLAAWSGLPGVRHLIDVEKANTNSDEVYKDQLNEFLRVGPNQMPGLKAILDGVLQRLGMGSVELLIDPSVETSAYTYGIDRPVIVMTRGLLDSMTDDEIAYVIGHELGHHLLGSIRYSRAANWVASGYYETMHDRKAQQQLYFILGGNQAFDSMKIDPEFYDLRVKRGGELTTAVLKWKPFSEFSCDRVGAIAVGDAEAAVRATFKLVIGAGKELQSRFGAVHDVDAFLAQHDDSLQLATEETKKYDAVRSHPFLAVRMRALRAFGLALPAYAG